MHLLRYFKLSSTNRRTLKNIFLDMLRSHKFFSSSYHLSPEEYNIWKHIKAKNGRFTQDM